LYRVVESATLLIRRGICADCILFYFRWQLLSVWSALTPGPNAAVGGMVAVAAGVGEASIAAEAEGSVAVLVVEGIEAAMVEAASAAVMEAIEVVTVAGDMDAAGVVGDMGIASG